MRRKIQNSRDDIKYECSDPENTKPIDSEINYCKDGFYPIIDNATKKVGVGSNATFVDVGDGFKVLSCV